MTTRDFRTSVPSADRRIAAPAYWFLGNRLTVLADHTTTGGRYDLIEGRPPADDQTPPHRHTRYSEQLIVLDGELTVWVGRNKSVLHSGDTFTIPIGELHVVAATGGGPAHGLVIASPSGFGYLIQTMGAPDTGVGPPPPPTPAEMERIVCAAAQVGDEILGPPGTLPEAYL